ncbi:MAG TPA: di-heme oxidoredictase family protein [Kofleriaceae bacterium]|nr:di-heme oxidoredictase family protein [Kofleriaceae bacterium]
MATSSLALGLAGCAASDDARTTDEPVAATQQAATAIGDPLPGTDPAEFAAAKANFAQEEEITDGLGPVFNERACGNCHGIPTVGGSGNQIERRYGSIANGMFFAYDRAPENQGGTLRQLFSNGTYKFNGKTCTIPVEHEPADANIHNVGRRSLPLFGLGLVDAMPDGFFDLIVGFEPVSTRGTVLRRAQDFPDSRDPAQGIGIPRVQRFGIKDQQTNLVSFAGDAYINEMGISTQSCFKGTSITAFATENQPNNAAVNVSCNGGDLKPRNPDGTFTDDVIGSCAGGLDAVQDDMENFRTFMEHLAPPPQDLSDPASFAAGAIVFAAAGCINCHSPLPFVTPAHPFNGVPGNFVFFPFSDFAVHDMGSLGDGIGNTGDSVATTRQMRTAPLWGARFNTQFLHDGRAKTVRAAILAHDGQGLAARNAFAALDPASQALLLKFVNSI